MRPFVMPRDVSLQDVEIGMYLYRILTGGDDAAFCHKVSKALIDGWVLYGEPKYVFDENAGAMKCAQAVTKEVDDQPYDPDKKLVDY